MTNQINQIQATYNIYEDRIRLSIKTEDGQIFNAWLTRRFLGLLLPVLHGQHPTTSEALFEDKATSASAETSSPDTTQANTDFNQPYEEPINAKYPLGKAPLLLTKITFKDLGGLGAQFMLEPETGSGFQLPFNPELLTALLKILSQALQAANWQLDLNTILEMPTDMRLQ